MADRIRALYDEDGAVDPLRAAGTADEFLDAVFALYARRGRDRYEELVTQSEHALQGAELAAGEFGAEAPLIAACLLHDIGHLLVDEKTIDHDHDDLLHEAFGADMLAPWFPPSVTDPIRWHVLAKRWLATREPAYLERLSPASTNSLHLQGGPLDEESARDLEQRRHFDDALTLRRIDDRAKVAGAPTRAFEEWRPLLLALSVDAG